MATFRNALTGGRYTRHPAPDPPRDDDAYNEVDPIVATLTFARIYAGLSQAAVARQVGTVQSAVSDWETGRSKPNLDSLRRWCEALQVDLVARYRKSHFQGRRRA